MNEQNLVDEPHFVDGAPHANIGLKDIVNSISFESSEEELRMAFDKLIKEINFILNIPPINKEILIFKSSDIQTDNITGKHLFEVGAIRSRENNSIIIEFLNEKPEFFRVFFLREAYRTFVPQSLNRFLKVMAMIHQIVLNDLEETKEAEQWIKLMKKTVIDAAYVESELDKTEKFLKQKPYKGSRTPVSFFFDYLEENSEQNQLIEL